MHASLQTQAFANFVQNMGRAYLVNTNPNITWWASATKFYHLNFSEFAAKVLMTRQYANLTLPPAPLRVSSEVVQGTLPAANVSWIKAGKTTPVKDQVGTHGWYFVGDAHPQIYGTVSGMS